MEDTGDSDGIGFDPIKVDVLFYAEAAAARSEVVSRPPHRWEGEQVIKRAIDRGVVGVHLTLAPRLLTVAKDVFQVPFRLRREAQGPSTGGHRGLAFRRP